MWQHSLSSSSLVLIDRTKDSLGQILAQLVRRCESHLLETRTILCVVDIPPTSTQQPCLPVGIEFMQCECDHIFSQLDDYSASFLDEDEVTQQHPSVLKLLTLDTSQLSRDGLASVSNFVQRLNPEYLNIMCTPFDSELASSIAQVHDFVQWATLKSLAISGSNINEWLQLWSSPESPQLLCLGIHGTGSARQELSPRACCLSTN
ncbi:hypothetical protein MVEG_01312 [Podila verticillata NRRL 6337]|nr:hypothetical protein MVEG_01312 [Podila verticillata NRRL 6337]